MLFSTSFARWSRKIPYKKIVSWGRGTYLVGKIMVGRLMIWSCYFFVHIRKWHIHLECYFRMVCIRNYVNSTKAIHEEHLESYDNVVTIQGFTFSTLSWPITNLKPFLKNDHGYMQKMAWSSFETKKSLLWFPKVVCYNLCRTFWNVINAWVVLSLLGQRGKWQTHWGFVKSQLEKLILLSVSFKFGCLSDHFISDKMNRLNKPLCLLFSGSEKKV